ncbi:MAG: N-acetylmuramoyl-L-alanine amidase family protein [Armatimonadota bacterium]|nr:N-acetylmuramoyl-L-alanine amidase family protein [Armatimonadota bacterium]MDW8155333.1 N-acetylmuramoyl-L-alanine amidase family protein [Armatimonadota bacterium]
MNGQPLQLDPPPAFRGGVLLAPLQGLLEPYAATGGWDPLTRTAQVVGPRGSRVVFRAGDRVAVVDGQTRLLPVPPEVAAGKLLVPVEFLFRALGAWVKWEEVSSTLHVASQILRLVLDRAPGGLRVQVEATGPVQVRTAQLSQPDRLVVDLVNAASRIETREVTLGEFGVRRVRVAQFQVKPYVTRVVLDLDAPVDVEVAPSASDVVLWLRPRPGAVASGPSPPAATPMPTSSPEAVATPSPSASPPAPSPALAPSSVSPDAPKILEVTVERQVGRLRVVVQGDRPLHYHARELPDPDRLVLDIPGVFVPVKQELAVGGPVEVVRAAQFQTDPDVARVVVQWQMRTRYEVVLEDGGSRLVVVVDDVPSQPPRGGHVVAIDPGHGGKDPGAIGATGLVEKDVVLDVGLRLRDALRRQGVRAVMTRESDVFVDLADRVPIALRAGATVFVSVHANATTRGVIRGVETYYLKPDSVLLATLIQEELGRSVGIPDRGIRTANFKVLRDSPIPAVLVEVGYLTNLEDEALLRTPAFRQRVAEAIGRGVVRFISQVPALQP